MLTIFFAASVAAVLIPALVALLSADTGSVPAALYAQISTDNALLADILPPPAHLMESYATAGALILATDSGQQAVLVDSVAGVQDVAVIQHSPILERVRTVGGSAILGTGDVCIVLHPADLFAAARARATEGSGVLGGSAVASVELKPE